MIQVQGLSRNYGSFTAVDNVSFNIGKGEIVGLLGHNGAGKTTIMKMLTGYLAPSAGEIIIGGMDLASHQREVQGMIGYLPENCPLYSEMSVIDYLFYQADLHAIEDAQKAPMIREAMNRAKLMDRASQTIGTLSRGYRQRVGVAQAILAKPAILILDEPTNGLDPTQIHEMRDLIRESAQQATVILSTHILQEAEALCDRVLIIRNGALVVDARMDADTSAGTLIVGCDAPSEQFSGLLASLLTDASIKPLSSEAEKYRYLIERGSMHADDIAPQIATMLTTAGFRIFELQPHKHDLEALFRNAQIDDGAGERLDA